MTYTAAVTDMAAAAQGYLDRAGVNENGEGLRLGGYATAIVYVRPDGTNGLTVIAPYDDANTVAQLLDSAQELVVGSGRVTPFGE